MTTTGTPSRAWTRPRRPPSGTSSPSSAAAAARPKASTQRGATVASAVGQRDGRRRSAPPPATSFEREEDGAPLAGRRDQRRTDRAQHVLEQLLLLRIAAVERLGDDREPVGRREAGPARRCAAPPRVAPRAPGRAAAAGAAARRGRSRSRSRDGRCRRGRRRGLGRHRASRAPSRAPRVRSPSRAASRAAAQSSASARRRVDVEAHDDGVLAPALRRRVVALAPPDRREAEPAIRLARLGVALAHLEPEPMRAARAALPNQLGEQAPRVAAPARRRGDRDVEQVHLVDAEHRDAVADQVAVDVVQRPRRVAGDERVDEVAARPRERIDRELERRARRRAKPRSSAGRRRRRSRSARSWLATGLRRSPPLPLGGQASAARRCASSPRHARRRQRQCALRRARPRSGRPCRARRAAAPAPDRPPRRRPTPARARRSSAARASAPRRGTAIAAPVAQPRAEGARSHCRRSPPAAASRQRAASASQSVRKGAMRVVQRPRVVLVLGGVDLVHARVDQRPRRAASARRSRASSATASRLSIGSTGLPAPKASPCATEHAVRRPVNAPGPRPKAIASRSASAMPASPSRPRIAGSSVADALRPALAVVREDAIAASARRSSCARSRCRRRSASPRRRRRRRGARKSHRDEFSGAVRGRSHAGRMRSSPHAIATRAFDGGAPPVRLRSGRSRRRCCSPSPPPSRPRRRARRRRPRWPSSRPMRAACRAASRPRSRAAACRATRWWPGSQEVDGDAAARSAWQADKPVNPASLMKLVTTFAGLELLGPAYTWSTPVWLQGTIADGVLTGNLVIKGNGDPEARARAHVAAAAARAAGRRARDPRRHRPRPQRLRSRRDQPGRLRRRAAAALQRRRRCAAAQLPRGAADLHARPGARRRDDRRRSAARRRAHRRDGAARGGPVRRLARRAQGRVRRPGADASRRRLPGRRAARRSGRSPTPTRRATTSAPSPASGPSWAASSTGVVRDGAAPTATPSFELRSPTLAEVVRDINKLSNNVMAQQLFLTLGATQRGAGTPEASRDVVRQWLRGRVGAAAGGGGHHQRLGPDARLAPHARRCSAACCRRRGRAR